MTEKSIDDDDDGWNYDYDGDDDNIDEIHDKITKKLPLKILFCVTWSSFFGRQKPRIARITETITNDENES